MFNKKINEKQWIIKKLSENKYVVEINKEGNLIESFEILKRNGNCFIDGLVILYFPNQIKRLVTTYSKGVIQGKEICYYSNGNIQKVSSFEKGQLSGYFAEYFENGYIKTNGKYENGLKQGEWITYYPSYKIKSKGKYFSEYTEIKVVNNGDSLVFKGTGKKNVIKKHYSEALDSLITILQMDDISDLIFPLKLYAKDGEWNYYDESGNVIKREYYQNGTLLRTEE
jgi:antitoxin component YwqK of YwqJK toxin-antitoxin module